MKKSSIWNIISLIIWIAVVVSEIIAGVNIIQLDMLPTIYLALIIVSLVLIALLLGLLMYQRQGKYQKEARMHIRQIIAYILCLVMIAGCGFVSHAASKINATIDKITTTPNISAIVNVYVLNEDSAQTITDAKGYTFAVTDYYDWENTQLAIADVEAQLDCRINTVNYPNVFAMIDGLYSGEANALFLNSAYVDILDELDAYADFADKARILYEHTITEPTPPDESVTSPSDNNTDSTVQETSPVQSNDEVAPFVIYLSGSDTRNKLLVTSRNDVNILAVVNPQTKQILLINTPRDYYVPNPAGNGIEDKLTHCGIYGVNCSIEALEALYSTDISYYARINFTGFETLIDAIGGVTVYSDVAFTTFHGKYDIQAGENYLNGSQALGFARERYSLAGGDNARGKNQMKIITAVVKKMSSASTLVANYAGILDSLQGMFVTDVPQDLISDLVKMQLSDMSDWDVLSYAATGKGGKSTTYSMPNFTAYVMYPNQKSVDLATQLIDRVLAGEILTSEDLVVK